MDKRIYIAIKQTKNIRIGDVFEQTPEGFYLLDKEPYRSEKTGQMAWKYKRKLGSIAWPYETVAPYVIEQAYPGPIQ